MLDALNVRQKVDDKRYGANFDAIFRKKDKKVQEVVKVTPKVHELKGARLKPTPQDRTYHRFCMDPVSHDIVAFYEGFANTNINLCPQVDTLLPCIVNDMPAGTSATIVSAPHLPVEQFIAGGRYRVKFPSKGGRRGQFVVDACREHKAHVLDVIRSTAHNFVGKPLGILHYCMIYRNGYVALGSAVLRRVKKGRKAK